MEKKTLLAMTQEQTKNRQGTVPSEAAQRAELQEALQAEMRRQEKQGRAKTYDPCSSLSRTN